MAPKTLEEMLRPLTKEEYNALPPIDSEKLKQAIHESLEARKEFERRNRPHSLPRRRIIYRTAA